MSDIHTNPLAEKPVGDLLRQFAIPSIIAMLVGSLYNIVDQFFIGQSVGPLGNAATTICYPLTILCIALALLFGIGGASSFNLSMGMGKRDVAKYYIGSSITMMALLGVIVAILAIAFTSPLLLFFGSSDDVLPYAITYCKITAIGFPFLILSSGGCHLVRADGNPNFSMILNLTGAIINVVLDALFVFGFGWGIKGAAIATIVGQIVATIMLLMYMKGFKTVHLDLDSYIPHWKYLKKTLSLGAAAMINQCAMMLLQIVLNKSLKHYGALSIYGAATPQALSGILNKVISLLMSIIIGISQGLQPIASFNYGAKNYERVKHGYLMAIKYAAIIACVAFVFFFAFPRQIISIFGSGSDEYFQFGIKFARVYYFFTFTYFMQPITSNFFTAIGKPKKGIFLAMTRQIIFYLPTLLIMPLIWGIDGIMYAGAVTDIVAFMVNLVMIRIEFKKPEFANIK